MPEYLLAAYIVRVRPRSSALDEAPDGTLDDFDASGSDLLQFICAFCNAARSNAIHDLEEETYLTVTHLEPEHRTLRITVESGNHGYRARLRNVDTHTDSYQRMESDAELLPLRNLFILPAGKPLGLFLTERLGMRGIKTVFFRALSRSFKFHYPEYILELNPLAPEAAVSTSLTEGTLKRIRLIRRSIPADIADRYDIPQHERELGTMELILKPPRSLALRKQKLIDALSSAEDMSSLLEVRGLDYDDLKLEVRVGRSMRTLTVTQARAPRVTFNIPPDVETDVAGRPLDKGIYDTAGAVAVELGQDIGLSVDSLFGPSFEWSDEMLQRVAVIPDGQE